MHSPIIYLISNDSDFAKSLKGQLPEDNHLSDEEVLDLIPESDWLSANTLAEERWHRNQWNEEFVYLYEHHDYLNLIVHDDNEIELSINKDTILNWDKNLIEINQKFNEVMKKYHDKNETAPYNPFDDIDDLFKYEILTGQEYGGERFAVFVSNHPNLVEEELNFEGIYSLKGLIDYARYALKYENKDEVSFQMCMNVVGDYHF